ncbi:putative rhamnosyl transferase [Phaeobacter sp. QD34_3]|uniref:putative rhamnosyl transferase n=1 Tax=unclassified Phaeobacter TaxID=2621772 RepID=UPI00237FCA79|nr:MULTISPECIES: putative rhamnosyl transferase [unclassified Phaeobacter]MDE4134893.1 putative rhamnosyl transferase [Phaeobacter sp. QD34_3]MDE4138511.1 putative rhamnosyl transferase [Phaeobacter sp. QD34_24]MDE4176549.1 putative rhamnosyl transferase [Phaeobacter sp. PT47_59]
MQIIGLCRFSYVGLGGYKIMHDSLEERRAFLYAPERLEERFRLFETICLPSVTGQTDRDFQLHVVVGECFPQTHLERLLALTEDLPNVAVSLQPPERHRRQMIRVLNAARTDPDAPCLQFRLDDDDAMAVNFIDRLRQAAEDLQPIWQRYPLTTIDFNKGYIYRAGPEGLSIAPDREAYAALSLGVVVPGGSDRTIMHQGHHNLWKETPTLTFPDGDMYMRGHNGFNDSRSKGRGKTVKLTPVSPQDAEHLKRTFNVDSTDVARAFSSPGLLPLPVKGE